MAALLARGKLAVLTGAGCSTASGIPDYRGEETRRRAANPIEYRAFMRSARARARYWARSMVGWPRVANAAPNTAHRTLAGLGERGYTTGLITQNVDGLHQAAGDVDAIELHGSLAWVRCMACGHRRPRADIQEQLQRLNPDWSPTLEALAPDGDAHVFDAEGFQVPGCSACGDGPLKPDVVFFGESVPRDRVDAAMGVVARAESLLVVGTSLAVFSGLRFVRWAWEHGRTVAIVTDGPTRGDRWCHLKLERRCETLLPALAPPGMWAGD